MAKEEIQEQLNALKEQGKVVYSISRLNTFNSCEYCYHLTYNLKLPQVQNPYAVLGGEIHDCLEGIYNGVKSEEDLKATLDNGLLKCELFDIRFPSENIKDNWVKDMKHFVTNFKKLDGEFITEKGFIYELEGILIQGFIDAIVTVNNETKVLDWKTSSTFTGDKLRDAGRQLVLYKTAIESLEGINVTKSGWDMLKYVEVCYNGRTKICSRRNWVKDISKMIATDLKRLKVDPLIAGMYIEQALLNNNLDGMPDEIKSKYQIRDCIVYYDITEERVQECNSYIINTVNKIESKDKNNDDDWKHTEINGKTLFFCQQLCGQRENCKFLKQHLDNAI